jgi:hypothetical protein
MVKGSKNTVRPTENRRTPNAIEGQYFATWVSSKAVLRTIKLNDVIPDVLQKRPAAVLIDQEASFLGFLKVNLQHNV